MKCEFLSEIKDLKKTYKLMKNMGNKERIDFLDSIVSYCEFIGFKESSENLDDLLLFISKLEYTEWAHIYDLKEKQIIFETQNLSDTIFQCNFQWVNKEESDGI